jgi:hypothetical protein
MKHAGDDEAMRFVNNFQVDECSVPEGMTLAEWRRANARPRKTLRERMRLVGRRGQRAEQPDQR